MRPSELRRIEALIKRMERAHEEVVRAHEGMYKATVSQAFQRRMERAADQEELFSKASEALRAAIAKVGASSA
jgi:hypothetical protein